MTTQTSDTILRAYRSAISQERGTGRATEHSYRPALKALVEALGGNGIIAINDPTHVNAGAPDFIVQRHSVPLGHIECKDIGDNLNSTEQSEQLQRYRNGPAQPDPHRLPGIPLVLRRPTERFRSPRVCGLQRQHHPGHQRNARGHNPFRHPSSTLRHVASIAPRT